MRVVFVLPSYAAGGAERVAIQLANALEVGGHEVHLIVFDPAGALAPLPRAGVARHELATGSLRRSLRPLAARLRVLRPDAVFSTFLHVNLPVLATRPLLPRSTAIVIREANLPSLSTRRLAMGAAWRGAMRALYPTADAVVASSARMADELGNALGVPAGKLHVLANPVDEAAIRRHAAAPERTPGEGRRFVAAGRLVPQKGFDRLMDIARDLPPEDRIDIYGEGPEAEALEVEASEFGDRVTLRGHSHALAAALAGADAFLMPSRFEGMPNAALESLAAGTPVIATPESGGLAEVAEAAPAGAVRIAAMGEEFLAAARDVTPAPRAAPGPSLLPADYRIDTVAEHFRAILAGAVAGRRGEGG